MAAIRPNPRLQVGSASWVAEERSSALRVAEAETEEFTFSARNEVDWLNEHMAEIFTKNEVNVAEIFKTPGILRGKTPRTVRKGNPLEARAPLTDVFSSTPQARAGPFKQIHFERPVPTFRVAEDDPMDEDEQALPSTCRAQHKSPPKPIHNTFDSGYHGSQADDATQATQPNDPFVTHNTFRVSPAKQGPAPAPIESPESPESESEPDDENVVILGRDTEEPEERRTTEGSFQSAREEQTCAATEAPEPGVENEEDQIHQESEQPSYPVLESPIELRILGPAPPQKRSPLKSSPARQSPAKLSPTKDMKLIAEEAEEDVPEEEDVRMDDVHSPEAHSPSDGSSPLRPIVRKSSLNFASLPAREPLTTKKSIGNRVSRPSQLEQSRTSYYGRQTGGKSLGDAMHEDDDGDDEMDVDVDEPTKDDTDTKMSRLHNKTSTQRLQDQISMLGQSQASVRPSKSFASSSMAQSQSQASQALQGAPLRESRNHSPERQKSPERKSRHPGTFPEDEDEDDSWIGPPPQAAAEPFHLEQEQAQAQEQERVAAMQKEIAARKEQEKHAKASQADLPRPTRTSPRKTKAQLEAEGIAAAAAAASTDELSGRDVEMSESQASQSMPPPAIPRPKSQIGRPAAKRPLKPSAKESATKGKPTVIRVDTGSQRGHHHHPSNSTLAASLQHSLASSQQSGPAQGLKHKASTSSIQSNKTLTNSFKSAASKALEAAARKKEQDDLAAQKKREAKQEVERQRAAIKEEERRKEEQQRREEVERQRELQKERERANAAADAKKTASRQAIEKRRLEMEKAKESRAPPPAIRPQPSCDLARAMDKALPPVPQQRSEVGQSKATRMNPGNQRSQEEMGRSMNSSMQNSTKAPPKRPLQQDADDYHSRPTLQRNGPAYQEQQAKRPRMTEEFDDDDDLTENHPKMTAPPIRQSSVRQKDAPTKSLFPIGYANAPPPTTLQRSTLISQHQMNQSKPAHPMDMAQLSKAPIPFASSSSHASSQQHKTPARPGAPHGAGKSAAKSAAKSSPRYQIGESIELPEIHTDSDDENSDAGGDFVASGWTESPALRERLIGQEGVDPASIFGLPGALNMEEVFSKSKDRFHKFRARTSSANWSGQDRLTEDEIRKDIEARDKLRRQGGWTYDSMV